MVSLNGKTRRLSAHFGFLIPLKQKFKTRGDLLAGVIFFPFYMYFLHNNSCKLIKKQHIYINEESIQQSHI